MEYYIEVLEQALGRYFKTLENYGYYKDTDKLIVFIYIMDLFQGVYDVEISDCEYKLMKGILTDCLMGDCIIPYDKHLNSSNDMLTHPFIPYKWLRAVEDTGNMRLSEDSLKWREVEIPILE